MSDLKLVSPLLDGFLMGEPMSSHDGVTCCPAMKENSDEKYIVKIISVPASQKQLEALLLTGAYRDAAAATEYFKELSDGIVKEAQTLQQLAKLEGFLPYDSWQVVPMEGGDLGYQIYLLSSYKRSLEKYLRRNSMTHLGAVNLGLDLCAALAICRRAGYLYVDLKPSNIYLTGEREYRIGDLGFVDLKSLKYTALPSKYRSAYTAPELHDALATLNPTIDTYAVGMILYQIYNNGQTAPQTKDQPAPLNADYEMAEIIMKAISPDPRTRWQNPIDMGQALVGYMQRNIVNDTPIVPPVVEPVIPLVNDTTDPLEREPEFSSPDEVDYLGGMVADETAPDADWDESLEESQLSDDISSMLAEADELIAHETPDPLSDDPPESDNPEDAVASQTSDEDIPAEESQDVENFDYDSEEDDAYDSDEEAEDYDTFPAAPRKKRSWVSSLIAIILLALLIGGGFYFYRNYYLLEIDKMDIQPDQDTLTVQLVTDADETLLRVVCTDTYGNTITEKVVGGQAIFTALNPATTYKITVEAEGFHALSGSHTGTYTTQEQTRITEFTGITGAEDGSVVLNFAVEGRETQEWVVQYSTEGEPEQSVSFTGHKVTISNLTVGRTYTFALKAPESTDLYITGNDTLEFIASRIVLAEALKIVSCENGVLTAQWNAPADIGVDSWTVRCYANDGYDETITTTETSVQFSGISEAQAYTIEVTAAGMGQGVRAYVSANPTTVTDLKTTIDESGAVTITWEAPAIPSGGWLLMYSVDGSDYQEVLSCAGNTGTLDHCIPGAVYDISVQAADGSTVFGGNSRFTTAESKSFSGKGLVASDFQVSLCLTPDQEDWTHADLSDESYTTTFTSEQKASMVVYAARRSTVTQEQTHIMLVVRNSAGKILGELVSSQSQSWNDIWSSDRYAYLELPNLPHAAGSYTLELYFDCQLVATKDFTVTAES